MMIWPSGLAILYPQPDDALNLWKVVGAGLLIAGVSIQAFRWLQKFPYIMVGWFWYLGTLIPTIGLVHAGLQAMADRYTYVPLIGLFLIIVWGVSDLSIQWPARKILLGGLAGATFSILMVCTWLQVKHWDNSITLFEHTIKVTDKNYIAHLHLGSAYQTQGRIKDASVHYQRAIDLKPNFIPPYLRLGRIKEMAGELDEAKRYYQTVVKGDPNSYQAHFSLANIYIKKGQMDLAQQELEYTLKLRPSFSQAKNNLGFIYHSRKDTVAAYKAFQEAVDADPQNAEAHQNLGIILKQRGDFKDAERELLEAIQINPNLIQAHRSLGFLYLEHLNRSKDALNHFFHVRNLLSEPDVELEEAIAKIEDPRRKQRGIFDPKGK
jgi:tetratricopeptide (TPR) repeat protein